MDTAGLIVRLEKLRAFAEAADYAGWDPYDALNSPVLQRLTFGRPAGRILWTQLLRRCPLNFRRWLFIRPTRHPKALGLFLEGYARLQECHPREEYVHRGRHLLRLLAGSRGPCHGNGWGHPFEWQSRAFRIPAYTPTIVNSAFIGHALLDAFEQLGLDEALQLAAPVGEFILRDLNRIPAGDAFCFSYTPLDRYAVHNANLTGASLLIRIWSLTGEPALRDAALAALAYSMRHQHADGSWFYSEMRYLPPWKDSFHTGFNLEAIRRFLALGQGDHCREAYDRGVRYYARSFFLEDGTPKYHPDQVYPIDVHAAAEGITFFAGEPGHEPLAERILRWTLACFWDGRGFFYYRKGRHARNKIPYMRWSQAWMFRAMCTWLASHSRTWTIRNAPDAAPNPRP